MIKLSKRLKNLAEMVTEGFVLADIGTDHGYVPVYLLQTGRIQKAFAMDIGKGPLASAKEHIVAFGLGDYITLRLSDGVKSLAVGEADSILVAGMGGGVMLHILEEGEAVIASAKELILQPQSEIEKVREYLYRKGFAIDLEDIVFEDGKYYPMMHINVLDKNKKSFSYSEKEWQMIYRYGELILNRSPEVLHQYLLYKAGQYGTILENLMQQHGEAVRLRKEEIQRELSYVNSALEVRKEEERSDS